MPLAFLVLPREQIVLLLVFLPAFSLHGICWLGTHNPGVERNGRPHVLQS
ncbi:MAG TPA: hypothetical protein VN708_20565 [Terriglobales bacterium]|nr:hypothetical protein [Terriglobales bacterium]